MEGDHVTLSGGEPTLAPFFLNLIRELVDRKIRITLLSNGSGFTSPEMVAELAAMVKNYPFNVVIALHSSSAELHDTMTGTQGSFAESTSAIHQLMAAGVNVTLKHILCKKTAKGMPDLAAMIAEEYPPEIEVQFTSMDYSGRAGENAGVLQITFHEAREYLNASLDILLHQCIRPHRVSMLEMPLCACSPEYWHCFHLTSGPNLYLAPNVEKEGKMILELPNQCGATYPPCEDCDVRGLCPGTWRSAYERMGKRLLDPVKCIWQNAEML